MQKNNPTKRTYQMTTEQNKMNLEIKHLCGYLPYGLGIIGLSEYDSPDPNIITMNADTIQQVVNGYFKPLLRPLSSMTDDEKADVNMIYHLMTDNLDYAIKLLDYYYQKHFDIHGLIENGLAIDLTTLKLPKLRPTVTGMIR